MSLQKNFPKYSIFGVQIDRLGISQALELTGAYLKDNKKPATYIVKPYVEFMVKAKSNPAIRNILNQAYLSLPDGVSLNWAVYFKTKTNRSAYRVLTSLLKIIFKPLELHLSLPNHAWATNFTWSLLETCAQNNFTVYLVGSPKSSEISHTAQYLKKHIPGLRIAGFYEGKTKDNKNFSEAMEDGLLKDLIEKKPDIVLLGLGFPLQEEVAARLAKKLPHGILIGEGGTFDFANFGGHIKKAPKFFQARGLEWAWRLIKEPKRFKRQLAIPKFIWQVYRDRE